MSDRIKKGAVFGIGILLGVLLFNVISVEEEAPQQAKDKELEDEEKEEIEEEEETYTLLFTGDIMLDRGVKEMTEKHGEDFTFPFLKIEETLNEADILFGNLESIISDQGRDVGAKYSFRTPPRAMEGLSFAGFDVVSLANNHAFDYGREAFEDTMKRLEEEEIKYTGAGFTEREAHSPVIQELPDGTQVGFLGYTEFLYPYAFSQEERSGITNFSTERMENDIEEAKRDLDLLFVSFHYGEEYEKEPNESQRIWSKTAIESGADGVIGHHPHVTQPVETHEEGIIAYSLGNFVFDQYFSEETMRGFMLEVEVKGGEIEETNKIHYRLNDEYQPVPKE